MFVLNFDAMSMFTHQLREQYLKESMSNRRETYAAIEKMLSTLNDPFTRFLEPSRYDALKGGTRGTHTFNSTIS